MISYRTKTGLSNSALKVIAAFFMLIDHSAVFFLSKDMPAYIVMRIVGRIAFPIFAYLVSEGIFYSKNLNAYCLKLLIVAVLTEIPINIAMTGKVIAIGSSNVLFTFALAVLPFAALKTAENKTKNKTFSRLIFGVTAVLAFTLAIIFKPDYDVGGVALVWTFYVFREYRYFCLGAAAAAIAVFRINKPMELFALLSLVFLFFANGERGWIRTRAQKLFFYLFYPLHMLVLYLLSRAV